MDKPRLEDGVLSRAMLVSLSIRDIVSIDRLDLHLDAGLCVLTGETGAGKSILLDALGLAMGARGDAGMIRHGAAQGVVSAEFNLDPAHPIRTLLVEHGVGAEDNLVLRRVLNADGPSRAFVDDAPVSATLLRRLGESLIEIHGQHEEQGLLSPAAHRGVLDLYAGSDAARLSCRRAFETLREAEVAVESAETAAAEARRDEEYLRHALAEMEAIAPQSGEAVRLDERRALLRQGEKLIEALRDAERALTEGEPVDSRLRRAQRGLERIAGAAQGRLDEALAILDRAAGEAMEATAAVEQAVAALDFEPSELERIEERRFALNDLARKHRVDVDQLAPLAARFAEQLSALDEGDARLTALRRQAVEAEAQYEVKAQALSKRRKTAARKLDKAVLAELEPLGLGKTRFATAVESLERTRWSADGADRVAFQVATLPGAPLGPLNRIVSGGELSRFMLALKAALAETRGAATLIFDEVDRGVGGAIADRVGARLAKLADRTQVLVVTHSPQVAARGAHHWRVSKQESGDRVGTIVEALSDAERREEVARMLAGAEVTQEARAAAESLIGAGNGR